MQSAEFQLDEDEYTSSWKRWLILAIDSLLNMSVAMVWLCFSPIAYKAVGYYDTNLLVINTLSLIFMILAIPCGILCMWTLEKYGLRVCLLICAWLGCIGSALRICSTLTNLSHDWKLAFLFIGQIITAFGSPFGLYTPAKLAASWFPENQRTIANTIAASANPVGIILTGLISPLFLYSDGTYDMQMMLITYALPPFVGAVLTTIFVTSDGPSRPPSFGGEAAPPMKVREGLKEIMRNKMFVLLMIALGTGIGLYSAFATLLEQVLCPWGYTDQMAGVSASVLTASGIVGAIIISTIVDRTKRFSEALKAVYCLTSLGVLLLSLTHQIYMGYGIVGEVALIGFFAFTIYPIGTEIAAECTYPIGVATSTGLIQLSGQLQSIVQILLLSSIGQPMKQEDVIENNSQCHVSNQSSTEGSGSPGDEITYDMRIPTYVAAGIISSMALILTIFFRPQYRRMDAETRHNFEYQMKRKSLIPCALNLESEDSDDIGHENGVCTISAELSTLPNGVGNGTTVL